MMESKSDLREQVEDLEAENDSLREALQRLRDEIDDMLVDDEAEADQDNAPDPDEDLNS